MNIQLYLADQELELNNTISFPLNKTFENLYNPTDIIVDYSKSINIPITQRNNKIFANAYRLDKTVVAGDTNIGMYLNPIKRIPFKMLYNGNLLLEGYAKFVSATNSISNSYYTINLFGIIGEVFQELMNVVTNESKLNGLDSKYLLNDGKYFDTAGNILNRSFVRNCWERVNNVVWEQGKYKTHDIFDMYGFAPSHRGLYNDFKSNKIQTSSTDVIDVAQLLREKWNDDNDAYGADNIVGDGLPDYQMNQFRTKKLKPYVFFNHLMRMYVDKCKELTGYTLNLDSSWFNANNPYWSKVVYMLDFLDLDVVEKSSTNAVLLVASTNEVADSNDNISNNRCWLEMEPISAATENSYLTGITVSKFNIGFGVEVEHRSTLRVNEVSLLPDTQVIFTVNVNKIGTAGLTTVATKTYWTNGKNDSSYHTENGCDASNFLSITKDTSRSKGKPYEGNEYNYEVTDSDTKIYHYVTVPSFTVSGDFSDGYQVDVDIKFVNKTGYTKDDDNAPALYIWEWLYKSSAYVSPAVIRIINQDVPDNPNLSSDTVPYEKDAKAKWTFYIDNTPYITDWEDEIKVNIDNLYQNEEPLFNVILQYTKMFGLVWDVDYNTKNIYIKTKYNLFKDKTITSWDDKLDRSKDMIIEPITFDHKSVKFNYDNVEGYRYSTYRDKYGLNIGEKKLYTGYEFNSTENALFKGIKPSSASSKVYVPFNKFLSWNRSDTIIPVQEKRILIDCENEEETGSISINNWYFRGPNVTDNDVIIVDDSPLQAAKNEYYYMDRTFALSNSCAVDPKVFPIFSSVYIKDMNTFYGLYFNTPNVDYTYNKMLQYTLNTNIYNLFWKDYINEKYNVQNKKVTAYFHLNPSDFNSFKFNKLVTLQNQVFLVNKIIDYNLNVTDTTKCELIQISDLNALTSKIF